MIRVTSKQVVVTRAVIYKLTTPPPGMGAAAKHGYFFLDELFFAARFTSPLSP
jgi:hypothetical protein